MLKVVFEDDYLIVFDKPPGLVVTKNDTSTQRTLEEILKEEYKIAVDRGGIVHRLDKDTSGLLVVAKTAEAMASLQSQFKDREIDKEYLCLVHGWVESSGKIEAAIGRNPKNPEKFVVFVPFLGAKEATTEYYPLKHLQMSDEKLLELFPDFNKIQLRKLNNLNYQQFTLLKCKPLTGRTHQIRVHLKHINFPIVGDEKYGGRRVARLDHRFCKRQFLHAAKIEFTHPKTRKRVVFDSPLPEDLQKAMDCLQPKL